MDYHLAEASFITTLCFGFYNGVNMLDRLISLIGNENVKKIENINILLVGIGGVGGYAFETLIRSGIKNITIIDNDRIELSNLNRQIITNKNNIGNYKVEEAKKRALEINDNININALNMFLDNNTIKDIDITKFDYVIDACDTLKTKKLLIEICIKNNIKIISSMGTAKKLDATKLCITSLDKTSYDKLAKSLRKEIDKKIQKKVIVVSSTENCMKGNILGSTSYVPAASGILITNYIVNDILKN